MTGGEAVDLARILRPGDRVLIGAGAAEPLALTRMLLDQSDRIPAVEVLLGFTMRPTIEPRHLARLPVIVFGGYGANAPLVASGAEILPAHVSALPELIETGLLRVDVLLLQCGPADDRGVHNLGVTADVILDAARRARVVIAEVNDQMPRTYGDTELPAGLVSHRVRTSRPLPERPSARLRQVDRTIASRVAEIVPDRSVLQVGIGRLAEASAAALRGHRDLGVHSGFLGDWLLPLVEGGAVTNAYKPVDRGVTVGGVLMGGRRLYAWADGNPALALRSARYTHGPAVLARFDTLVTINSAVEVDLTGQVNAETVGGRYLGAVGGGPDYIRAGTAARRGRSIIVVPSSTGDGKRSRIVTRISDGVVTTPRSDVDTVVTEHGVAELRGQPLGERARRLLAIASPAHRDELEKGFLRR